MALPIQYDLPCKLVDLKTQKEIAEFKAREVTPLRVDAAFEGGNVASGGQSFTIATPDLFDYKPYAQQVIVEDTPFMIVARQTIIHMQLGRTFSMRSRQKEIILELQ